VVSSGAVTGTASITVPVAFGPVTASYSGDTNYLPTNFPTSVASVPALSLPATVLLVALLAAAGAMVLARRRRETPV
jgi:hypothetical protein